ncbi:MAG: biotin-dependent carboxyltransferase family protein [Arcobacter sp.]|uniref:5-oxoprolinase subunit C family protein n=1 Tax=Arcobacter sp. TaxID=1872629 RepID=UPI003D072B6B
MSLEVINNPLFVTIQDRGRFGYAHIGVTNSGVMDEYAYFWANKLLKNSFNTNILEIAFSNVIFKANENTQISITGANCEFFINDEKKELWQSYNIKKNDIIKIGKILSGNRIYLAVFGGFDIKKEFGSNSVTIKENLGGLDGNKLKKGNILPFNSCTFNYTMKLKEEFIPKYEDNLTLRVIFSYQENYFLDEEKKKFLNSTYLVTNDFNRMAVKLSGEAIKCEINGIISEGIAFGSIQIPNDGQPIVLLKDRQTIGGYPKIGVVLGIDCFKLSQARANTKIKFEEISYEEAVKKTKEFYSFVN